MSERKVLNKYYPPDFDPSKIPRMKLAKNRQYTVRLMAPFNMRCVTCGEYIYKGKKFNARKEDVENDTYLGIRIYRFYIKCTRCLQEISFKTDPKNTDYEIEAGATRNFMALKLAEEQAKREEDEAKEEEANNPMKLLENRTEQSRQEIEILESLEELRELNKRQGDIDYDAMLSKYKTETPAEREAREAKEDEEYIKALKFGNTLGAGKRVVSEEVIEEIEECPEPTPKVSKRATDYERKSVANDITKVCNVKKKEVWDKSIGIMKKSLVGLVKPKSCTSTVVSSSRTIDDTSKLNNGECETQNKPASGLSLLAGYSDSEESA